MRPVPVKPAKSVGRRRRPPAKTERTLAGYLGLSLSAVLLLLVIALAVAAIILPRVTGAVPLAVLTSSMEPGLPPGTLIVVKPQPVETIKPGDVVTYQIAPGEPDVITHRVIAISSTSAGDREFITQGDNNGAEDDPVIEDQIMGVLWYSVPYLGFASTSLNGEARTWIIPAVATALFVYAGFSIAAGVVAARRRAQARRNASRAEGALDHGPNERRASSTGA